VTGRRASAEGEAAREPGPAAVLTVAGSDSGGGAGIQADLRTFAAHGVVGCTAITAVTAQDTGAVYRVDVLPAAAVAAQMRAVLGDLPVRAVKTGMLARAEIVRAVAEVLGEHPHVPLVVDPVLRSTSGRALLDAAGAAALRKTLLPRAALVTPNLPEAAALLGPAGAARASSPREAAPALADALGVAVLVKGGHAPRGPAESSAPGVVEDALALPGRGVVEVFAAPRVESRATRGTGCTLASAIAANLALGAVGLAEPADPARLIPAIARAKAYLTGALRAAVPVGAGGGPVDHLWRLRERARRRAAPGGQGEGSSK